MALTGIHEKHVYRGEIVSQALTYGKDDVPQLEFMVALEGELVNRNKPDAGLLDCPKVQAEVRLTFPLDDDEKLGYAQKDLERLGFEGDDLEMLNPDAKKHKSFIGTKAHVAPSFRTYADQEQVFWNFRFPKAWEQKPIPKGALSKSPHATAYKELMARRKQEAADAAAAAGGKTTPF